MSILPQFWACDTSEVTKGLLGQIQKYCILLQFWASDTSEVTKGSLGQVQEFAFYHSFERPTRPKWRKGRSGRCKNSHFTTVLSVRHVRSDERVDRRREKFAFYHSFERPTRTKWREGCQIHRCDPCAPTEKEYILRLFQKILWLAVFLCSLFSSPFL